MGVHTGKLSIYYCLQVLCYQCKLLRNGQPVKHKAGLQQKASMTDVTTLVSITLALLTGVVYLLSKIYEAVVKSLRYAMPMNTFSGIILHPLLVDICGFLFYKFLLLSHIYKSTKTQLLV